jgi:hypothetical protein
MGRRPAKTMDLTMPFAEALERFIRVDPKEMPDRSESSKPVSRGTSKPAKKPKKPSPSKTPKPARGPRGRKGRTM